MSPTARPRPTPGWPPNPDVTLETTWGDWIAVAIRGEDPRRMLLRRRLRPHGSLRSLMRLGKIFPRADAPEPRLGPLRRARGLYSIVNSWSCPSL